MTATSGYTTGPFGSYACYVSSTNNISVSGGALQLTVRKESSPFTCGLFTTQYTAGMVSTYTHFSQTYGRFEVRALLPQTTASGLQETLWLWPLDDTRYGATWPDSGEVDFSEFYSEYSSLDIPYIHYNYSPATVNPATTTPSCGRPGASRSRSMATPASSTATFPTTGSRARSPSTSHSSSP